MAASRVEQDPSAQKTEGESPSSQEDLLCRIKSYLIASKTPADDWKSIKDCVEEGVGFPDVRRRPPESATDDDPQGFKDESMSHLKSDSKVVRPIKSAEILALLQAVVDDPERWMSTSSANSAEENRKIWLERQRSRRSSICCMPSIKASFDEDRRLLQAFASPSDGALVSSVEFEALEEAVTN